MGERGNISVPSLPAPQSFPRGFRVLGWVVLAIERWLLLREERLDVVWQLVCLVGDTPFGRGGHEPERLRGKVEGVVQQDAGVDETQSASAVFH